MRHQSWRAKLVGCNRKWLQFWGTASLLYLYVIPATQLGSSFTAIQYSSLHQCSRETRTFCTFSLCSWVRLHLAFLAIRPREALLSRGRTLHAFNILRLWLLQILNNRVCCSFDYEHLKRHKNFKVSCNAKLANRVHHPLKEVAAG